MNDFLINELKKDIADREVFKGHLMAYQESLKANLKNGVGEQIKKELENAESNKASAKIKTFFKRLLNTL